MKNENKYFELVKQASENVSKYVKQWSELHNERWGEYEATWKALLFHELILIDEKLKDNLSMENSLFTKDEQIKGKRMDIWLGPTGNTYAIEVKRIHYNQGKYGYGIEGLNSQKGVYGDLLKLKDCLATKDVSGVKGIAIAVLSVRGEEDRDIQVDKIIAKIQQKIFDLINDDLRLLICSNGKCAYATADTD